MTYAPPLFIGKGNADEIATKIGRRPPPWEPFEGASPDRTVSSLEDPALYIAGSDLTAAVNTALLLGKPLLLAGNPGTGKSQVAERIAWEFGLGAVLRFEAQSISEAQDLFYRFDLVGQVARSKTEGQGAPVQATEFVSFGPLGKAILRAGAADTAGRRALLQQAFGDGNVPTPWVPRRSVVLIDEIDKASRDFPNDLLNAIERFVFEIRELPKGNERQVRVSEDEALRPIVVITSNGEREIPAPFLRRCVFCHIPDPSQLDLQQIVINRIFGGDLPKGLPLLYEQLLSVFADFRQDPQSFAYRVGTAELVDWTRAVKLQAPADASKGLAEDPNNELLLKTISAVAKNQSDCARLRTTCALWIQRAKEAAAKQAAAAVAAAART